MIQEQVLDEYWSNTVTDRAAFRRELAAEMLLREEGTPDSWWHAGGGVLFAGTRMWRYANVHAVLHCAETAIWQSRKRPGREPYIEYFLEDVNGVLERHEWASRPSLERAAVFAFMAHARVFADDRDGEAQRLAETALGELGDHAQVTGSSDGVTVVSILRNLIAQLPAGRAVPLVESMSRRWLLRHLFILRLYAEGVTGVHAPALAWALELLEGTLVSTSGDKAQVEQIRSVLVRALTRELERSAAPCRTKLALVHLRLAKAAFAAGETEQAAQHQGHAAVLVREHDLLAVSSQRDEIQELLSEVGRLLA